MRIVGVDGERAASGVHRFHAECRGRSRAEDMASAARTCSAWPQATKNCSGVLYVDGDTAHTFTMPEEDAARAIQALP